ncbi:oxygenase MpaB family protein [Gordonia sp. CPCC 205515]|uniref:oxygenase MpaB family protein n=1 Tax=Gordonia sp. CPCC 205515 TaxID=3140791 RepID=UPI003AF3BA27
MYSIDRNSGLDPDTDFEVIYRNLVTYDFPWDMNQSLSFALFRTYAVPSIGRLLDATGEFTGRVQKRYDDTGLLLEIPLLEGISSPQGRSAVRRINQMHRMYDISNDDMRYVLSTFVVVPKRWIDDFGWRRMSYEEVRASVRYYQMLGKHMGITDIPETYEAFARFMDDYEQANFAYDEGARRVADSTLHLMTTFYPGPVAPVIDIFSRSLMDPPLLNAFHYRKPGRFARWASIAGLKARARVVAVLPSRRKPRLVRDMPRIRSYPNGFDVDKLGTFAPGCPVHRNTDGRTASVG